MSRKILVGIPAISLFCVSLHLACNCNAARVANLWETHQWPAPPSDYYYSPASDCYSESAPPLPSLALAPPDLKYKVRVPLRMARNKATNWRRLAQQSSDPLDTDVQAISTSALIPYEFLYGKVIPSRLPCPEGDPGVTGDNCGENFNPCETHPVAGPANTCRRLNGFYRCIPNTCTQAFKWRGVELPENPCTPLFLDSKWGVPQLWCTHPAYTGGIPGVEPPGSQAAEHARSAAMAAQHQPRMQQNAADVGKRAADYNQLLQQQPGPPPAKLGAEEHGDWKYGHQEGMDLGRPSIVVPADEEKMSRVGRGLKQDLPPEVLAKLAEMGLSEDDVEIVQYPPGTDPDAALNDFYSRQAGGGGRGGVGGGGRSYSTAVPPSQTYEQPRSALDGFFSEDLFEIPAILAFELMDSARNLAPFLQESFGGSGTGYASQLSDWTSSNNGMSSNSSNSIDISLPGVLSDGEEEKKEGGKGSGDEKEDGNGDDEEGGQKNKKEEVQDSLTSIWDDYKKKVAREDGKNINASTLCKCSSEGKVAVCCAGARQYASKCEAECVNEDMGICTAGPCS